MATSSSQRITEDELFVEPDVEVTLIAHGDPPGKKRKYASIIAGASILLSIVMWMLLYYFLPEVPGMEQAADRLEFALRCISVVALLTMVLNVQSVSLSRFFLGGADPVELEGNEPISLKIDQKVLQQTLEQLLLFTISLLGLTSYCSNGKNIRAITATSITWVIQRWMYWTGFHFDPLWRVPGVTSVTQSMIILIYVTARFGYDIAGFPGAILFLFPFLVQMTMSILGRP